MEAMRTACEGARAHILRGPHKQVTSLFLPRAEVTQCFSDFGTVFELLVILRKITQ